MDQQKVAMIKEPKTSWTKEEVLALMAATANHVRTNGYGGCSVSSHLARVLFDKWNPNQPEEQDDEYEAYLGPLGEVPANDWAAIEKAGIANLKFVLPDQAPSWMNGFRFGSAWTYGYCLNTPLQEAIGQRNLIHDLQAEVTEIRTALVELMADVRNKPNDCRYATHLKKAQDVLDKYTNHKKKNS